MFRRRGPGCLGTIIIIALIVLAIKHWKIAVIIFAALAFLVGLYYLIKYLIVNKRKKDYYNNKVDLDKLPTLREKKNDKKGEAGEFAVRKVIAPLAENGKIFNDVIISDENGESSQIDHIIVCSKGVFVIETKNYSGKIYGNEDKEKILVYLNDKQYMHYNPVKQNETHVRRLEEETDLKMPIYSIIVFVQNNADHFDSDKVVNLCDLRKKINSYPIVASGYNKIKHDIDEIERAVESNDVTLEEHVEKIKENEAIKQEDEEDNFDEFWKK